MLFEGPYVNINNNHYYDVYVRVCVCISIESFCYNNRFRITFLLFFLQDGNDVQYCNN